MDYSDCGRYELIDPSVNAKKFWVVCFDESTKLYFTAWGRIGSAGSYKDGLDALSARKKIYDKKREGYKLVERFNSTLSEYQENVLTKKTEKSLPLLGSKNRLIL